MTIFFIFFIFLISIVLVSITSKGEIVGLLNQSGFVYYTLTHFNNSVEDSNASYSVPFNHSAIGIYLPKNATILSAFMNISGISINEWVYDSKLFNVSNQTTTPEGITVNDSFIWIFGKNEGNIFEFNNSGFNRTSYNVGSTDNQGGIELMLIGKGTDSEFNRILVPLIGASDFIKSIRFSGGSGTEISLSDSAEQGVTSGTIDNIEYYWMTTLQSGNLVKKFNESGVTGTYMFNFSIPSFTPRGLEYERYQGVDYLWILNSTSRLYRYKEGNRTNATYDNYYLDASTQDNNIYDVSTVGNFLYLIGQQNVSVLRYTRLEEPNNLTISINGTIFFNHTNKFNTINGSVNVGIYIQDYLTDCIPDTKGYCNVPINISSTSAGKVRLFNLQVNYTYDISSSIEVAEFTNKTYNFTPLTFQNILKKFRFKSSFPTTDLNITGFFVNDSSTNCFIDGASRPVGTNSYKPYCNLTTPQYLNSSGGTWTNHTVFDNTTKATYSPVNLTNSSQLLNNSRERIRFFNVTSFYPNGSIANDSLGDIIYNITVQINLTDTDLPNRTQGYLQGLKWYNGSEYIDINISNRCTVTNNIYEDNYTHTLNAGLNFSGCYNDSNNNDVWDYFKILVPKFSNQQFYVFGQEDTDFPNVTIIQPSGTFSSSSITLKLNVTDDISLSDCYYNITNDIETIVEVPKTTFTCGNYSSNHTISTNDDYFINVFANDTSGNINITRGLFSVNIGGGNGGGGGGGGGGGTILTVVNVTNETIIITENCNRNGICEAQFGEDFINCHINSGGDCQFSLKAITCDDPSVPCIFKNAPIARIVMLLLLPLSLFVIILTPDQRRRIKDLILSKKK